jgi:outer membrane lipoprotein SlyB
MKGRRKPGRTFRIVKKSIACCFATLEIQDVRELFDRRLWACTQGMKVADAFAQKEVNMKRAWMVLLVLTAMFVLASCSTPMTTRETGAAVGAVGGAAAGGIIGSAVGHPGAGAAIGGTLGLGAGALIGDQIQALQRRQADLERQLRSSEAELDRQREELDRIRNQSSKEY